MSEYGSGITMRKAFAYDRERIEHALDGQLICGETEDGFLYQGAPKEACEEYILQAFDNAVYEALEMADSARVLEEIAVKALGDDPDTHAKVFRMYVQGRNALTRERIAERKSKKKEAA